MSVPSGPRLLSASTLVALLAVATCSASSSAATVQRARVADKAKNATKVNGIRASKTPKAGRLLPLDKNGMLPVSVFPKSALLQLLGGSGAQGVPGPVGAKGDTGTVDTSNFFTKDASDGRFLAKGAKADDASLLDGLDSSSYLQVNPAAPQDPPVTPLGAAALWVRPTVNYTGSATRRSDFKVLNDGGLLATGELGIGSVPATGCGYRMTWFPSKAAFRAGSPGGCPAATTRWDEASSGYFSWAGGTETTASGVGTLAFGDGATASNTTAVALGTDTVSSGPASLAAGASSRSEGLASTALGYYNRAAGQGAVALGYRSGAIGNYSVALGQRAVTASGCPVSGVCDLTTIPAANGFDGAFVWSDGSSTNHMAATADNQFSARAAGGVRLFTNSALTTGCSLPAGSGVWSCTSDRNAKHDFQDVDELSVLERLSRVPVTTWRYKSEKGKVRHMGPTAQDFRAAFGLGPDDKHIGSIDEDGVNTAAIQALYKLSQRQQERLDAQDAAIARLERRIAALATDR